MVDNMINDIFPRLGRKQWALIMIFLLIVFTTISAYTGTVKAEDEEFSLEEKLDYDDLDARSMSFHPSGDYLAVSDDDTGDLLILDTSDWSTTERLTETGSKDFDFSPSGDYLATTSDSSGESNDIIETDDWSIIEEKPIEGFSDNVALSDQYFASGEDNNLEIYNKEDWSPEETISEVPENMENLEFSPCYEYLGATINQSHGGDVYLIEVGTWESEKIYDNGRGLAFSDDRIAVGSEDNSVPIFDYEGTQLDKITTPTNDAKEVDFCPNYNNLAIGSLDGYIYIHESDNWDHVETLTDPETAVYDVEFSSSYLTASSWDDNVYIYNYPSDGFILTDYDDPTEFFLDNPIIIVVMVLILLAIVSKSKRG